MNQEAILSIVIPTYNRVKFLETTVNIFIDQIKTAGLESEVEIIIGDDTSPDETAQYLKKLEASYPFIKTFTNPKNLGISGNVEKSIRLASGEFVWLFGDDDLATDLSVEKLVKSIKTEDPNIVLFNTVNMISLDNQNLNHKINEQNRLDIDQDIFIESLEKDSDKLTTVKDWLYLTNLVSASAFKKELFLSELVEAKKYLREDNVYLFQAPLIIGIAKWGRLKIIASRCVLHRKNETNWSGTTKGLFRVSLYDASEVVQVVKKYIPNEYKKYQKIFAVQTFNAVKTGRELGEDITKDIISSIKKYYSAFPYSIRFFIALVAPEVVFKTIFKLNKKV